MTRKKIIFVSLAVAALAILAIFFSVTRDGLFSKRDQIIKDGGDNISDYSAVFISNGQVFFGKIYGKDDKELDLRDVYYLKVNNQSELEKDKQQIVLSKLGDNELHGPNDRMLIYNNQIQYTESLRNDAQVVTAIKEYKAKNNK